MKFLIGYEILFAVSRTKAVWLIAKERCIDRVLSWTSV